ncbi:hypothetical protein QJQ45_006576 [Haematococcus lacustris]|nr:hypothetical protein QJQ45_006576 [Haematococcus lacustris]
MERHGRAKQLVLVFGAASIGTNGRWGADAVLWSQQRDQPVRGLMWCPVVAPRKPPQAPRSSQEATQPAAAELRPSTPPSAKRTEAEQVGEPTQPTKAELSKGKAAKAKPAPQPGRWLDRGCNAALNMRCIGESRWCPLELCWWPEQTALPAKGKEYPGQGFKRLRDKPLRPSLLWHSSPGGRKKKVATVAVAGKSTGPKASSASGAATAARPAPPGSTGKDNKEGIGLGRGLMGQEARARLTKRARVAVGAGPARAAAAASHADLFAAPKAQATVRSMVYGFGDDESPLQETIDLVEEVLMHFLRDIMQRAVIAAADSLRAKPDERDILFVEKKDAITTVVCLSKHLRPDLTDSQFKQAVQREEDVLQQGGWVNSELETFVALLAPKPPDAAGRVVVEPVSMRQAFWGKAGPRGFPLVVCMPPPLHQSAIGQLGEATQPAASEPGPNTPPPAKRSKRTEAGQAAEPTQPAKAELSKGKAAKAKPAPQPGRWLDRDCNAALNMRRVGESRWCPLELCWWPEQTALPAKGKEYPGLGYKQLQDKPPKAQPAMAQ